MWHYYRRLQVTVALLNCIVAVQSLEEIATTTRTYDLQVPGSEPIRIIEAEPLWGRNRPGIFSTWTTTTSRPWTDLEHRSMKPYVDEDEEQNRNSSEELEKFLRGYAERLRRTTTTTTTTAVPEGSYEDGDTDFSTSTERLLHKVELVTKPPGEEPTNRLASLYLNSDIDAEGDEMNLEEKTKGWNLLNLRRHKHPYDDKDGWVSLEVAPWSVSKVSKWHSNAAPESSSIIGDRYGTVASSSKPIWNKPMVTYQPGIGGGYARPDPRPSFTLPTASYNQKVYMQQQQHQQHDYADELPKPWNKNPPSFVYQQNNPPSKWDDDDHDDPNCDGNRRHHHHHHHYQRHPLGIITDGRPANFPKSHNEYNRRRGSSTVLGGDDQQHPATYPINGDGEWVLLSTTKGYKPPPIGRQRSLELVPELENDSGTISTHKSVRLTVLPPEKDSKINMTTSHGGLLQVESTFETVDEARKLYLKRQQSVKRKPNTKKKPTSQNKPLKQQQQQPHQQQQSAVEILSVTPSPQPALNTKKKRLPSASSVLAAVGAGMIPATMAMLVPMTMGRRKRRKRSVMFDDEKMKIFQQSVRSF